MTLAESIDGMIEVIDEDDSITKRRTRVDAVFNPDHSGYENVLRIAGKNNAWNEALLS